MEKTGHSKTPSGRLRHKFSLSKINILLGLRINLPNLKARSNYVTKARNLIFGKLGAIGIRAVTLALGILSITLTAPYLGISDFGRYALLQAVVTWTVLATLGLQETCSGIINKFRTENGISRAKNYVDNSFITVASVAGGFLIILLCVAASPWNTSSRGFETYAVGLSLALISVPFSLSQALLNANGEVARSMAWAFLTATLTVAMILIVIHVIPVQPHHKLLAIISASGLALLISRFTMHVVEYRRAFGTWLPLSTPTSHRLRLLAKSAYPFLILNVAALAAFQIDRMVSFYFLPPSEIAKLEVVMKVLMAAYTLNSVFNAKLWNTVGEAWNRSDGQLARRVLVQSVKTSCGFWFLAGICTLFLIEPVIRIFTRGAVVLNEPWLVITAFAYVAARGLIDAVSISIFATRNQHGVIRTVIAHGVLNIPMSIVGCALLGLPGIMIGQLFALVITSGWRFPVFFIRITESRKPIAAL